MAFKHVSAFAFFLQVLFAAAIMVTEIMK